MAQKRQTTANVGFMASMIRRACGNLAGVIRTMDRADVEGAIVAMGSDPTDVIMFEWVPPTRVVDLYESGGNLDAQRAELVVLDDVRSISVDRLIDVLTRYSSGDDVSVVASDAAWRVHLMASGCPRLTADVFPGEDRLEDIGVRIALGRRGVALDMFSRPMVSEGWLQATASLLHQWVVRNKQRPVTDHPAFDQVVVRPINGSPGIYLFRAPPVPFSPLLSADVYTFRPAAMIFETMEEFHEIEEYLQTPGACFFHQAPLFRVNPPSRDRPAVMPGGIREGAIHIIGTPWEGARAFSVYAVPDVVLEGRSSKIRAGLYRGRYATHTAADRFAADRYFRSVFGERMEISATIALGSLHPRAGGDQIGGHAGGLAGL